MATKPSTVPGWVPTGTTPSAGQKTAGFATNGPLPAAWLNWFWTLVSGWVAYLRDGVIVGEAGEPGLTVTAGSGNEHGTVSTGTGTGAGGSFTGGATGPGVSGTAVGGNQPGGTFTGAGTGAGVSGNASGSGAGCDGANSGAGPGLQGNVGTGTGYALVCVPNGTKGAVFLGTVAADPSSLDDGAIWYNSTAGKFRGRAGGVTVDFH